MSDIKSCWEIGYDGYYPYCKNCGYEPDYIYFKKHNKLLPKVCPKCHAEMTNADELNH